MKNTSKTYRKMKKKKRSQPVVFWKAPSKKISKKQPRLINFNKTVPKKIIQVRKQTGIKFFNPIQMKPVPFLVKESIQQKRMLNPWGDADLDGSPNKFDCNPRDPSQDGFFGRLLGKVTGGRLGQSEEEYTEEKEEKKRRGAGKAAVLREQIRTPLMKLGKSKEQRSAIDYIQNLKRQQSQRAEKKLLEGRAADYLKRLAKQEKYNIPSVKEIKINPETGERKVIRRYPQIEKYKEMVGKQVEKERLAKKPVQDIRVPLGKKGEIELLEKSIRERVQKGKEPSTKDLKRLSKLRTQIATTKAEKKRKFTGGLLSSLTPLGETPEVRKLTVSKSSGKTKQGRGRPKKASGKYSIQGQPVYEAVFQKVRSQQNEIRKYRGMPEIPSNATSIPSLVSPPREQPVPPVVREVRQELAEEGEIPEEYAYKEGEAIPEELYEQPQQQVTLQQAQMIEQYQDNILKAPNIMKGEMMSNTGGIMSTPPEQNILNAPNFSKGGLRRVGQTSAAPSVTLSERPNPNPYGEVYTEIDPGSGRVIVKRRPQEKWATGEAI